jgi:hypothetical protein
MHLRPHDKSCQTFQSQRVKRFNPDAPTDVARKAASGLYFYRRETAIHPPCAAPHLNTVHARKLFYVARMSFAD